MLQISVTQNPQYSKTAVLNYHILRTVDFEYCGFWVLRFFSNAVFEYCGFWDCGFWVLRFLGLRFLRIAVFVYCGFCVRSTNLPQWIALLFRYWRPGSSRKYQVPSWPVYGADLLETGPGGVLYYFIHRKNVFFLQFRILRGVSTCSLYLPANFSLVWPNFRTPYCKRILCGRLYCGLVNGRFLWCSTNAHLKYVYSRRTLTPVKYRGMFKLRWSSM